MRPNSTSVRAFVANPQELVFTTRGVKKILNVKNVSNLTRAVRLDTSSLTCFRVVNTHYPEMGSNLIAPGLSCSFGITLTAFEASATHCDTLKVIYESGEEPLSVQLIAKRETPQILFPQHAEVGACLVGSTKTLSLRFQISTSSARICVRSETDGAFKISPDRFDLSSGDYADLQVSFSPRACGEVTEAFKVYAGDVNLGEIGCHGIGEDLNLKFAEDTDDVTSSLLRSRVHSDGHIMATYHLPAAHPNFQIKKNFILTNQGNVEFSLETPGTGTAPQDPAFDWSIANSRLRAKSQVPISLSFCANSIGRHEVNLTIRGTQISNDCLSERHFDLVNLHVSAAIESPAIIMEPNLVQLERSIVLTETLRLEIKLTNPSAVCPIAFCWELSRMKKAFLNSVVSNEQAEIVRGSVDLESGLLQPLETQIIKLSLTPLRVGSIECLLPCRLNDQPDGLTWLQVLFVVVSPNIELETDSIDFGKLRPGQCATRTTYLANPASLSLSWAVKHPQMANAIFSIEPSKGIIKAKCNAKISLAFRPRNVGQFDVEIPFSVDGAPLRTLRLTGEAVQPVVIVEPQELQINEAFLNVPQTIEVNLKNTSAVSSTFRWLQVEDVSEGSVEVSVSPSCGHIGPNKCTIIRVMCTGKALGIFKDVRLYCEVDGLSEPLLLNLSVKVGGLSCRITAPSDGFSPNLDGSKTEVALEDGESVLLTNQIFEAVGPSIEFAPMGIHMPRECWIVINNTSGVPALCTLKLDNFESQERICFDEIVENDWQVQNRKVQDFCRRLLSTKKCFAISIDSIRVIGSLSNAFDTKTSAIDVPPYKSVAIRLVGCADIFGEFQDTLTISLEPSRVCSLGAQPLIARLPIVARACGSPVDFLTASKSVNKPIFNECYKTKVTDSNSYGLLLSSIPARETTANLGITSCISPNVRREVKLRNNSAFTIRVDWHLYRYSLSNNENHLLDLCAILNGCYHSVEGEEQKKDKSDDTPHLSLLLRPHEGRAVSRSSSSDKRFIEPTADDDDGTIRLWSHQTIIPPHNVASVFVDLNRVSASSQLGAKIRAYALGYISVDGAGRHVSLPEPLLCPQLRLNLKASVQQPMLELEYGDELSKHVVLAPGIGVNAPEPMRFTIGADNFILSASEIRSTCNASNHECLTAKHSDDEQLHIVEYSRVPKANVCLADRVWFLRRLRLRNRSPYGLGVQLEVTEGDFFFRDDYPLKAGHRNRLVKFLDPSIVKIEMVSRKRLIVKSESIESVLLGCLVKREKLSGTEVSTESEWFGRVSCELYNPEQAEIMKPAEDLMRVRVGVEGRLKLPEISVINTQALEFPDTFTSQSSMLDIKISNLGLSGTVWAVQFSNTLIGPHKSSKAGCQEAAFSINPRSGVLAAAGDPHLKDRAIITVEFKPLKSGLHVGELRIVDFLTRRSVALTLKGRGIDQHLPEITPW